MQLKYSRNNCQQSVPGKGPSCLSLRDLQGLTLTMELCVGRWAVKGGAAGGCVGTCVWCGLGRLGGVPWTHHYVPRVGLYIYTRVLIS